MAIVFPLYIDLKDNNCTVFGGGEDAYEAAVTLLNFKAKVTVICPTICEQLLELDRQNAIRWLRRKYFRGDCSSARLCFAYTDDPSLNIAISDECKNKNIPVAVSKPDGFGTFTTPHVVIEKDTVVSVTGCADQAQQRYITSRLQNILPTLFQDYENQK